jgi:hypothetical protein
VKRGGGGDRWRVDRNSCCCHVDSAHKWNINKQESRTPVIRLKFTILFNAAETCVVDNMDMKNFFKALT